MIEKRRSSFHSKRFGSKLAKGISAIALVAFAAGCTSKSEMQVSSDSSNTTASAATAEHGKYLVNTIGCNDCHTPWTMTGQGPGPDMTKLLSGHPATMPIPAPALLMPPWMAAGSMTMTAWSGPWGVSFAANLTPDSATGIGAWTQDQFTNTMRTGKDKGTGRAILPPMPWNDLKNLTDADLASIYLYLKTIPPISNQVPAPMPPMAPGTAPGMPPPPGMIPPPPGQGVPPPPPPPMHSGKSKH
ncbi:MAG TPA: diheme cytochrome c-553 [Candidatus Kapabacteria bacterium]|jgi:hypothetical protein